MLVFKQLFTFLKCAVPLEDNHNATVTESKDKATMEQLKDNQKIIKI
jgi:hypothetical protein